VKNCTYSIIGHSYILLKLSRRLNSIKYYRAHSHVNWLQEKTDVMGTISVPTIRVLMMGTDMVPETSDSSCNQLTRLCAQEDFIELVIHYYLKYYELFSLE
jgi:hypothetical protein